MVGSTIYPRGRLKDPIANNTDGIYLPSRNVATVWSLSLHRRCSSSDRVVVYPLLRASQGRRAIKRDCVKTLSRNDNERFFAQGG
jgi:hypothetical protein